jgi:hypothetical protein
MALAPNGTTPLLSPRLRAGLATFALLVGWVVFARCVGEFYPLKHWLFIRYLKFWALCAGMACACATSGLRVVAALGGSALRLGENLLLSFACGVMLFGLGVFAAGVLGWFGPVFFFAWPVVLTVLAGRRPWRTLAGAARQLRSGAFLPRSPLELGCAALLCLGLVGVYLQVLTPDNVGFDARWYHLGIAEQYAVRGRIERFSEGWYLGAYPQLATWLYTWAFLWPGTMFERIALATHVEWLLFLATLPGVGLLANRLLAPARVRWAGCAVFLFPSIYLYDSNLNGGADHVLAFWAVPCALATIYLIERPSARRVLLASLLAAGAISTRYQSIYLLVPASLLLLYALARAGKLRLIWPGVAAVLVLTSPHWLKNLVFYGDPLYPLLHKYLPVHPFHPGALDAMEGAYFPSVFASTGTPFDRLRDALYVLPTFAFRPNNWASLDLPQPTFGSLFSLLGLALPFVPRAKRIWLLLCACYLGIAIWYVTNHQDRFLQTLLPWMAACVVALCVRIAQLGRAPQLALSALVALQLVWGADFWFAPNHSLVNDSILIPLVKHLRGGFQHRYKQRFEHFTDFDEHNRKLPRNAVVLLHDGAFRLGLERRAVTDQYGYQGALSYAALRTPRAVWQAWRELGITHVEWERNEDTDVDAEQRARERVFRQAVRHGTQRRIRIRGKYLAELTPQPPR